MAARVCHKLHEVYIHPFMRPCRISACGKVLIGTDHFMRKWAMVTCKKCLNKRKRRKANGK